MAPSPSLTSHLPKQDPDFHPRDIHLITAHSQCILRPAFIFLFLQNWDLQALTHLINTVAVFFPLTSPVQPDPELEALAGFPQPLTQWHVALGQMSLVTPRHSWASDIVQ